MSRFDHDPWAPSSRLLRPTDGTVEWHGSPDSARFLAWAPPGFRSGSTPREERRDAREYWEEYSPSDEPPIWQAFASVAQCISLGEFERCVEGLVWTYGWPLGPNGSAALRLVQLDIEYVACVVNLWRVFQAPNKSTLRKVIRWTAAGTVEIDFEDDLFWRVRSLFAGEPDQFPLVSASRGDYKSVCAQVLEAAVSSKLGDCDLHPTLWWHPRGFRFGFSRPYGFYAILWSQLAAAICSDKSLKFCEVCQTAFSATRRDAKICSDACRQRKRYHGRKAKRSRSSGT